MKIFPKKSEVIVIDGAVQKANGKTFTAKEAEKFVDDFLRFCEKNGYGFGGYIGPDSK